MPTVGERDKAEALELLAELDLRCNYAPGSLDNKGAEVAIALYLAQAREDALREAAELAELYGQRAVEGSNRGIECTIGNGVMRIMYQLAREIRARIRQPIPSAPTGNS